VEYDVVASSKTFKIVTAVLEEVSYLNTVLRSRMAVDVHNFFLVSLSLSLSPNRKFHKFHILTSQSSKVVNMSKKAHALKLEDAIMKSGYLVKLAMGSGRNWKKRYFMLNGNTFTYYVDHKNVEKAKGDLLLTAEATVEESSLPGKPFCIMITTPFHTLVVAAKDPEERDAWRVAIEKSIMVARNSIRGYITKKGSLADGGKSRKFFILHEAAITWHKDHEHTQDIQGMIKLAADTSVVYNDETLKINLTDSSTNLM
jgi:hypothetical protein